jgi:hypothetical protein
MREITLQRVVKVSLLVFVVWIFVGLGQAHCQERADVVKPAAIYLSLSAADLGTTEWAIRNGASEGNPWMKEHRIAKQAAMAGAFTLADYHLQKRGHRGKARALRVVYAVGRLAVIAINVRNAQGKR